ncbi:MAG: N-acetylmuramoyl-L-alanine amidase [Desulfovibrio sp.]|nr:N-acetylmuramoyl-L-alanine amidase [Desulfovibrio sp.]
MYPLAVLPLLAFFLLCPTSPHAESFLLDPGHSPAHPGAMSCSGRQEYLYNDALARTILSHLKERGIQARLSRRPGEERSLSDRAKQAKGKKLLLSLHHDSVQERFLSRSQPFPCSNKANGYSLFVSRKNKYFEKSLLYARVLGEILRTLGLRPSSHHGEAIPGENRPLLDPSLGIYQYDDLVVLKNADAPAILLEAAVIVHPEDDVLAQSPRFQLGIAEAIAQTFRFVESQIF